MSGEKSSHEGYAKAFKWRSNPFSFRILPGVFVGYKGEAERVINSIRDGIKFSLVLGPTGSGKTSLMRLLHDRLSGVKYIIYLSKPPLNPEDFVKIFTRAVKGGFFRRIFSREDDVTLYELSVHMNKRLKDNGFIVFIDECHEAPVDTLAWLRTLTDQIENMSVVLAGLPVFESVLEENLETLSRRINLKVELSNLTKAETRELIKRRIEWAGGEEVKPFTPNSIRFIYERTRGFPREVLRICGDLVGEAVRKDISTIDMEFLREAEAPERIPIDAVKELPYRQNLILDTLSKHSNLTPSGVVDKTDSSEYKDRENAVRSVNNLLKRLMKEGLVEREKKGKTYRYRVSSKFKTLTIDA